MALPLRDAFTARSLGVMWDNYQASLGLPPYLGRSKFGTRKQDSLDPVSYTHLTLPTTSRV